MAQIVVEEVLAYTVYGKGLVDILSRFAGEKIDRVREVSKTFLITLNSGIYLWFSEVDYTHYVYRSLRDIKGGSLKESPKTIEGARLSSFEFTVGVFDRYGAREKLLACSLKGDVITLLDRYVCGYRYMDDELHLSAFVPTSGVTGDDIASAIQDFLESGEDMHSLFIKSDA